MFQLLILKIFKSLQGIDEKIILKAGLRGFSEFIIWHNSY